MSKSVGVYGIGTYLPEQIRTNEWWSSEVVSQWFKRPEGKLDRPAANDEVLSEGAKLVMEAMQKYRDDPFKGARQRRVMPEGMTTSQMEVRAAEEAIERSGVDRSQIDFVLTMTTLPDYLVTPNACAVHAALGLSQACYTLQVEGGCSSFLMQLQLAAKMIGGGAARLGLLVQSSGTSRLVLPNHPHSAWFGDGATAVVVGPVRDGYGLGAATFETDGRYVNGLVCGIPGSRWWEQGRIHAYVERQDLTRELLVTHIHESQRVVRSTIASAGWERSEVDFFAAHQGFAWFREATQRHIGIERARYVDTFPWAGSLLGANIPLVLATGERDGLLKEGERVVAFGVAAGATMAAAAIRWGGRD